MKRLPVQLGLIAVMVCGGLATIYWPSGQPDASTGGVASATTKEPLTEPILQPIPEPAAELSHEGPAEPTTNAAAYALPPVSRSLDDAVRTESAAGYQPQRMPLAPASQPGLDASRLALASAPVSDFPLAPPPADPLAPRAAPVRAAISSSSTGETEDQDFPGAGVATAVRSDFSPPPPATLEGNSMDDRTLETPTRVTPSWSDGAAQPLTGSTPLDALPTVLQTPAPVQDLDNTPVPAADDVLRAPASEAVVLENTAQPPDDHPLAPPMPVGADAVTRTPQPGLPVERPAIVKVESGAEVAAPQPAVGGTEFQHPLAVPRATSVAVVQSIVEADGRVTASRPGSRALEGEQAPSLIIDKWAPTEITVGEPAFFQLRVRNTGAVAAHEVRVVDQVPEKTQLDLSRTKPAPQRTTQGLLIWELGTLEPGEEQTVSLSLVATEEGEIGSVAQVIFHAQASVRTVATRADLQIQLTPLGGPMLVGDRAAMSMTVTNRGSGTARDVMVEVDLPDSLFHPAGNELENALGDLRPGESASMELAVEAAQGGARQAVAISIRSQSQTLVQEEIPVEVLAPQLRVVAEGPKRRYLERAATMSLSVTNPGTAAARNVQVVAALPDGLEFVQADQSGQYLRDEHAILWQLDTIAAGGDALLSLTVLPVTPGDQALRLTAEGDLASRAASQHVLQVKRRAELLFTVKDLEDPIEVGSETAYVIEVHNKGTKPEPSIRVSALLPPGLEYLGSQGPRPATVTESNEGQQIGFGPLPSLAAQETVLFRIRVRGRQAGGQVVRVQLSSDQVQRVAVRKEESTEVYVDQ